MKSLQSSIDETMRKNMAKTFNEYEKYKNRI